MPAVAPRLAFLIAKLVCRYCAGGGVVATSRVDVHLAQGFAERVDERAPCPECNGSGVSVTITDNLS